MTSHALTLEQRGGAHLPAKRSVDYPDQVNLPARPSLAKDGLEILPRAALGSLEQASFNLRPEQSRAVSRACIGDRSNKWCRATSSLI